MTKVDFYFNVPDKLAKTAQLCEEKLAKGRQLTVFTQETMNAALQTLLWQHSATSFLPSCLGEDGSSGLTPIVLVSNGNHLVQDDVLINLQEQHPPFFSRFRHLIELVGVEESDKVAARARFKFYRDRGYTIKSTDVANPNG
jgi:DNA polymerase-3 subunit chi